VALFPGARFGAYEILALLGRGGMGEVHRARDTKLRRDVAIKVCPSSLRTTRIGSSGSSAKPRCWRR
jgi:serine/threonine protein kinase